MVHSSLQHCFSLLRFVFMQNFLEFPSQHFNWVEIWTLTDPFKTLWFFSFSVVLLLICWCAWDHCPGTRSKISQPLAVRHMTSHFTLEYFDILRSSWSTPWLQGAQILWLQNKLNHHPISSLDGMRCICWYAMLGFHQMWYCALWPNIPTLISSVQRIMFQV